MKMIETLCNKSVKLLDMLSAEEICKISERKLNR